MIKQDSEKIYLCECINSIRIKNKSSTWISRIVLNLLDGSMGKWKSRSFFWLFFMKKLNLFLSSLHKISVTSDKKKTHQLMSKNCWKNNSDQTCERLVSLGIIGVQLRAALGLSQYYRIEGFKGILKREKVKNREIR